MQKKIPLIILLFLLPCSISIAQSNFPFIPGNQHLLTEEQIVSTQINITPYVLIFNEQGKILPMDSMSLMTNPAYKPVFYADDYGKVKSLIFVKKGIHSNLIEQNKEEVYTYGELAKDFTATAINGKNYKLSDLKGKVVVLNFWFTKCGPCVAEMPQLNSLATNFSSKDAVFIAITFNKKEVVKSFLKSHYFNYNIVTDAIEITRKYGVNSYPTSIVINKKGEIILKEIGYRTNIKEVLATTINAAL